MDRTHGKTNFLGKFYSTYCKRNSNESQIVFYFSFLSTVQNFHEWDKRKFFYSLVVALHVAQILSSQAVV